MAIWPFRRRQKGSAPEKQLLVPGGSEKSGTVKASAAQRPPQSAPPTSASRSLTAASAPAPAAHTSSTTRQSSTRGSNTTSRQRQVPQPAHAPPEAQQWQSPEKEQPPAYKENIPPRVGSSNSREDITALPVSYKLEQSPHLRPVDLDRPHIPYQFHPDSASQASEQRRDSSGKPPRPRTLHSKRSVTEAGAPSRRASSKLSRRRDDAVREEEIRAMSAPIPIPKRPGDGPLRRESKKVRNVTGGDSQVSLPPEGSVHSAMSGIMEQRGWEIGGLAVFNPRPSVRLSGIPQYVVSSLPQSPSGVLYRIDSIRAKEKEPVTRDSARKRRTVGEEADELGASDLRAIMERDAKRRERRQQDRQEKLEKKLKAREGRNRGDSDARRRRADDDDNKARAELQIQAHGPLTPPTKVHPALRGVRDEDEAQVVGLGIGNTALPAEPMETDPAQRQIQDATNEEASQDPFTDAAAVPALPLQDDIPATRSNVSLPIDTSMEEPIIGTAQAIQLSPTNTTPVVPTYLQKTTPNTSQLTESLRQESVSAQSASDLQPPPQVPAERQSSDAPPERRAGGWTAFFRRGGSNLRRGGRNEAAPPSESSFSNTSRESMRNQPLPAHLVGTAERPAIPRSTSSTPARAQSKFREDLPEMPTPPPDSETQSPNVPNVMIAARTAAQSVDIPGRIRDGDRNDTPVSQGMRGHTAMSSSLASIDSEGEWLAGGAGKRQSNQSALSRSLSKRNEFNASYEELGGDGDVEYMTRHRPRKVSSPALIGASPDEESGEDGEPIAESSAAAPTVRGSVRRRPTLVQHDPRLKSREGLVTEYASAEPVETPFETPDDSPERPRDEHDEEDEDDDEDYEDEDYEEFAGPQIERATSVNYSRHSRQFSAGSARLLDVSTRGPSIDKGPENKTSIPDPPATAGAASDE